MILIICLFGAITFVLIATSMLYLEYKMIQKFDFWGLVIFMIIFLTIWLYLIIIVEKINF